MCNLGVVLQKRGDTNEAEHWYRQAANAGLPEAMQVLAVLLAEQGDIDKARHWYLQGEITFAELLSDYPWDDGNVGPEVSDGPERRLGGGRRRMDTD